MNKYTEDLYKQYQHDKTSVSAEWQGYFAAVEELGPALVAAEARANQQNGQSNGQTSAAAIPGGQETVGDAAMAQSNVTRLVQAYRYHGHRSARLNPLADEGDVKSDIRLEEYGLSEKHLDDIFAVSGVLEQSHAPLREIVDALQATYCGTLAVQTGDMVSLEERRWLQNRMEHARSHPDYTPEMQTRIYRHLYAANSFERFLHSKFVGVKRFSIEGGESLIPMLDTLVEATGRAGMTDIVFGMAHRGRLNVLVNTMCKPLTEMFAGFLDSIQSKDASSSGDVKYHQGRSSDIETTSGQVVHLSLLNNPSHLEAVNPVVLGSVYAKQQRIARQEDADGRQRVLPLLIHGDAAFAGQGVVPETLNLGKLDGYDVGGTVHLVINNQIGFTACPRETFSGEYCTDVARMLKCPIFHVNGDDPEACVFAMELAFDYRQKFGRDVVIDLVCYRRHGHNEGDDPTFTHPVMYKKIADHAPVSALYKDTLTQQGLTSLNDVEAAYQAKLDEAYKAAQDGVTVEPDMFKKAWSGFIRDAKKKPETSVKKDVLEDISRQLVEYPAHFQPHKKAHKLQEQRAGMLRGEADLNWGAAEMAAYASLLQAGYNVRLSGQDVQRGTFSHRHLVMTDATTGETAIPIQAAAQQGAVLEAYNSSLSELAVLGFEFGFSLADPHTLTIWEAQFGDFANGAQIMIDQFIACTEVKWQRLSGLTLLLPHGYEGQGPEHSSARLERFLQLSGNQNWRVCVPTTPAQIFHMLRRQMLDVTRKPLVVMTPKSLLRHPEAVSPQADLTTGGLQAVIDDPDVKPADVTRVLLCSGKVYYDLRAVRQAQHRKDVAIIRLEELYPLPQEEVEAVLSRYKTDDLRWVQEEPRNMGAWMFLLDQLWRKTGHQVRCISRPVSASPAVGAAAAHKREQEALMTEAFED